MRDESKINLANIRKSLQALEEGTETGLIPIAKCDFPGCKNIAGMQTTHVGYGKCYVHDEEYLIAGLYQGAGVFTEALRRLEGRDAPLDDLDTQILIQQGTLSVFLQKLDALSTCNVDVPSDLLRAANQASRDLVRTINEKEKIKLQRVMAADKARKFVLTVLDHIKGILKLRITDPNIRKLIDKDLKKLADGIDQGEVRV